jgi:hypothetical protein
MKTACSIGALALLIACATAGTADAAKKNKSPKNAETGLRAIQMQCFKEQGAWFDAANKRWMIQGHENYMQARVDAVHACVKQRSGKDAPFVTQRTIYR